jgi:hypothetical protein
VTHPLSSAIDARHSDTEILNTDLMAIADQLADIHGAGRARRKVEAAQKAVSSASFYLLQAMEMLEVLDGQD